MASVQAVALMVLEGRVVEVLVELRAFAVAAFDARVEDSLRARPVKGAKWHLRVARARVRDGWRGSVGVTSLKDE